MGYDVLSMNSTNLPKVKWVIRNISMMQARRMLATVLRMDQADEIREFMHEQLVAAGLGRAVPSYVEQPAAV
jgi:phosphotransferase system enzyme I (PtsP)